MKNLPLPIRIPYGCKPVITQHYGSVSNVSWYKERGLDVPYHNGTDYIISNDKDGRQTYGSACIAPFKCTKVKTNFTEPQSVDGNGVTLQSEPFKENGVEKMLQIVYWHLSEIVDERYFEQGEVIGYIGNSGAVKPSFTVDDVYAGSHLHFMLFEFHKVNGNWVLQNADNGVNGAINPLTRFSMSNIIYGDDTPISQDRYPLEWAFKQLGITSNWEKIIYLIKYFYGK